MTTAAPGAHPLVVAYLADLERALATTDPQERTDILTTVREHIEDALDGSQDSAETKAVLADLGPVERIASAATPAADAASSPRTDWTSAALLICAVASPCLAIILPWAAAAIAAGTLVGAIIQLRRSAGRPGFIRAAIAFSAAALVVTALVLIYQLTSTTQPIDLQDVQPVASREA